MVIIKSRNLLNLRRRRQLILWWEDRNRANRRHLLWVYLVDNQSVTSSVMRILRASTSLLETLPRISSSTILTTLSSDLVASMKIVVVLKIMWYLVSHLNLLALSHRTGSLMSSSTIVHPHLIVVIMRVVNNNKWQRSHRLWPRPVLVTLVLMRNFRMPNSRELEMVGRKALGRRMLSSRRRMRLKLNLLRRR